MAQQSERDKLIEAQRDYERRKSGPKPDEKAKPISMEELLKGKRTILTAADVKRLLPSKQTVSPKGQLAPSVRALRDLK